MTDPTSSDQSIKLRFIARNPNQSARLAAASPLDRVLCDKSATGDRLVARPHTAGTFGRPPERVRSQTTASAATVSTNSAMTAAYSFANQVTTPATPTS